ncbi:lamin tail domain-containing protein, partial [Bacillaceae bacterium SIJ1]|nr:lamin tail domain-containing protein [Litoribacterium kuwaitense]
MKSRKKWRLNSMFLAVFLILSTLSPVPSAFASSEGKNNQALPNHDKQTSKASTIDVTSLNDAPNHLSPFLITELVPDTTNIDGADGFEFIEVYNASDEDRSFANYRLQYRYPDKGPESDLFWDAVEKNIIIPAREAVVFWIKNGKNDHATAADFNDNFGTSLEAGKQLFTIQKGGMANGGARGLIIATKTGIEVNRAFYNDTQPDDTRPDLGIHYAYPLQGIDQRKISAASHPATPGSVTEEQIPSEPIDIPVDVEEPEVQDHTSQAPLEENEPLIIDAIITDNQLVEKATLHYETTSTHKTEHSVQLRHHEHNRYTYEIPTVHIIGMQTLTYSIEVTDGTNIIETSPKTIDSAPKEAIRLNVDNESFVQGDTLIKGAATGANSERIILAINDQPVPVGWFAALENEAYLSFDIRDTNVYFKNAVTYDNQQILQLFSDSIVTFENMLVPISPSLLHEGNNDKLSIKAGNKK